MINKEEIEETDNGYKIKVPIISNTDLEESDYNIQTYYDEIIHKISETVTKDKDLIIAKKIINYQDKRIKELEEINKEEQKLNGELQEKLTYYENKED